MTEKHAGRIGVFGRSGSGKSTYVKNLIRDERRLVVFDPCDEYRTLKKTTPAGVLGAAKRSYRDFRLRVVPTGGGGEAAALSRLCDVLKLIQEPYKQNMAGAPELVLVVEEMNLSFPVHGGAEKAPAFAELCSRGRHWGIEIVGVSQRIAEVSTRFRGNLTEAVIFEQREPRDIKAAADALGAPRWRVEELLPFEYLTEEGREIKKKKNPKP